MASSHSGGYSREYSVQRHKTHSSTTPLLDKPQKRRLKLRKELSVVGGLALVINQTIGSGIFITSSGVLKYSKSFGLTMVLWLAGGLIAYMSSLCYLELALLLKKSGSTYIYIKEAFSFGRKKPWMEAFGSMCGFLVGWSDVFILQPLGHAIALLTFGRYICKPFFIDCQETPLYADKMFGLFALIIMAMVNIYSVRLSISLMNWLSCLKLLALGVTAILAIWKLAQRGSFSEDSRNFFEGSTTSASDIALGFYGVLYAYDGWSVGVMVMEETKNTWTLSWMVFVAMPVVIVVYIITNISFFSILSYAQILNSESIGLTFGNVVIGKAGLILFSVMVVILTFGSAHAGIFQSSREVLVTSREGTMPQFLGGIHTTYMTPLISVLLQVLIASILVLIGNIDGFVNAFNATSWFFYGSAIFGLIVMRITEPDRPRPFKVILLLPCTVLVVAILLVVLPLWQSPFPQLLAFGGVLMGVPVYCIFVMEKPFKLKPKVVDRASVWLTHVTGKLFNTKLVDY